MRQHTSHPVTRTPPVATQAHAGPCKAVLRAGTCPCEGLTSPRPVGLYRTCACGHTEQIHALADALPET